MSSDSEVVRPGEGGPVLLTKVKSRPPLGAMTMAFFRKGEDLEASGFENLPHDDPALVPPKLGFRTFDRVPRRRAPILLALLVVVVSGLTVFERHRLPEVRAEAAQVTTALGAMASDGWVHLKELVASKRAAR